MSLTIIEALEDKKVFGSIIKDQRTFRNWKIVLKAIFALKMSKWELEIYRENTGRKKPPSKPFKEVWLIIGRRGGKSTIAAIIAVFLAVFKDWSEHLAFGEVGFIMVIATDRRQASVVFNKIRAILSLPLFRGMILNETREEIELNNQVTISVVTCSYRALRGYTVLAAICDEIAFWRHEGANPSEEILTALRPGMITPGSLLVALSTPYAKIGSLYEAYRSKYGTSDSRSLVVKAPSRSMNPTIPKRTVDKALKEDYSSAKAEWLAEFREDLETFLTTEIIESCIIRRRFGLPFVEGVKYYAFTDPSGGRQDSFTLGIAHKAEKSQRIILDLLPERLPPFKPQSVVEEYSKILKSYGLRKVTGDKYAGEWVVKEFENHGIKYESSKLNKSEIYLEFEPLLTQGRVELLDNRRLFAQLRGLERRTRSGGKDSVDHSPGQRDDCSNAVAGACLLSTKKVGRRGKVYIRGKHSDKKQEKQSVHERRKGKVYRR